MICVGDFIMKLSTSEIIFYSGIVIIVIAIITLIVVSITLYIAEKRLKKNLEIEYGKKRH